MGTLTADTLCYGCVIYLSGHLKAIQTQLTKMKCGTTVPIKIAQLIRYHIRIIDVFEDFNSIASPIIFTQFSIASVQICVVAFQMTMVKYILKTIFIKIYILSLI